MAAEIMVKGDWRETPEGFVYTAKAVSKLGRILGIVNVNVPVDVAYNLRDIYGLDELEKIEKVAQEQVMTVAKGIM